jgi:hypothetical protein
MATVRILAIFPITSNTPPAAGPPTWRCRTLKLHY